MSQTVSAEGASEYLGCKSVAQFRCEVRDGVWPGPITTNSRPARWSIPQLDAALRGDEKTEQNPHLRKFEKRVGMA